MNWFSHLLESIKGGRTNFNPYPVQREYYEMVDVNANNEVEVEKDPSVEEEDFPEDVEDAEDSTDVELQNDEEVK